MNQREIEIKRISNAFANWQVRIANLNALSLYDTNIFSEYSICEVLNSIFGYKLINANSIQKNAPAIDLVDKHSRIAFQVTSTKTSKKIQDTLDVFGENKLSSEYDELFILVLGTKQKKYPDFRVPNNLDFSTDRNIIDFHDLLKFISLLPTSKIEKISKVITEETQADTKQKVIKSSATQLKRNLALKKKMKKDLLRDLDQQYWERAYYEPYIKFKYGNLIIRSVDDRSFPEVDDKPGSRMSSWLKVEPWDFYENGLELISMGGRAIFDKDGNWDVLDYKGDSRESNPDYKKISYCYFERIPFDNIVSYDMEVDAYYGCPSVYVEYANDGTPYSEILYGTQGRYESGVFSSRFDNNKRKKLP
jgi:hypothetical protein